MAANKFATMVHTNTNKITLILVYAVLEWILIVMLLLNSLFAYLIVKFAEFTGLKRPCLWCSTLEHVLEPGRNRNYRDLVCEAHAKEISSLGFCSHHQKLAEYRDMCEDCFSLSKPDVSQFSKRFAFFPWMNQIGITHGDDETVVEEEEENHRCSCCGENSKRQFYPSCVLLDPSWGVLEYGRKPSLFGKAEVSAQSEEGSSDQRSLEVVDDENEDSHIVEENGDNQMQMTLEDADGGSVKREKHAEDHSTCSVCDNETVVTEEDKEEMVAENEKDVDQPEKVSMPVTNHAGDQKRQVAFQKEESPEPVVSPQHLEFYIDRDDCRLIPVALIDLTSDEVQNQNVRKDEEQRDSGNHDVILEFDEHTEKRGHLLEETWRSLGETTVSPLSSVENKEDEKDDKVAAVEQGDSGEEGIPSASVSVGDSAKNEDVVAAVEQDDSGENGSSSAFELVEDSAKNEDVRVADNQATPTPSNEDVEVEVRETPAVIPGGEVEEDLHQVDLDTRSDEIEAEISIGTEIPDQEAVNEVHDEEAVDEIHDGENVDEIQSQEILSLDPSMPDPSTTAVLDVEDSHAMEEAVELRAVSMETSAVTADNNQSTSSELTENGEEKVPDIPISVESLHFPRKLLPLDRKESGTEESIDGSITSEVEAADGPPTIEKLKSALQAERKALNALYAELEEERSASAVAANQTMAMINRLQEEKAAMQMEALQYQRMMEEQAEYDQEALQLLNELVVKRDREKLELERELEIYRKKVQDYETKEKITLLRKRRTSSGSCSYGEDSEELSVDMNNEPKGDNLYANHEPGDQNTPPDAVKYLEESLENFEEERLSILEQLKVLENKLLSLSDEEEQHYEDVKPIEHFHGENGNGNHRNFDYNGGEVVNGFGNGHSKEMNGNHHPDGRTMGSKAKRLLPLFNDTIDAEGENGEASGDEQGYDSVAMQKSLDTKYDSEHHNLAVEEEIDHVYERLQALEADREFLKHCVVSLRKGDRGVELLHEILQHLRDLRSVDLRVKNQVLDGAL